MPDAMILDCALIDRLIGALREQHVPMAEHLNPGLAEEEMAALVAPLGQTLPQEAQVWWGYGDGVPLDTPGSTNLSLSWSWRPLAETVAMCRTMRSIAGEDVEPGEPTGFSDSWLPVVRGDGILVMDTADPVIAPVYTIDWHTYERDDPPKPRLGSLGALVGSWALALESRALLFDRDRQLFFADGDQLDALGIELALV
jgi:hypothetical protein